MVSFNVECVEYWCGDCVNRAINCDPENQGWSASRDRRWLRRFDNHFGDLVGVVVTTDEDYDGSSAFGVCELCSTFGTTGKAPKGDVYRVLILANEPDDSEYRCPACGELTDYCQGHGEIGDPVGFGILERHDSGDHSQCLAGVCPGR